jgi:hypothetical protein
MGDVFPDRESRATHPSRCGVSVASKGPRLVAGGLPFYGYLAYLEAVMDSLQPGMRTA